MNPYRKERKAAPEVSRNQPQPVNTKSHEKMLFRQGAWNDNLQTYGILVAFALAAVVFFVFAFFFADSRRQECESKNCPVGMQPVIMRDHDACICMYWAKDK